MDARKTTWTTVLDDFAQRSGRTVERRFFRWRHTVTVPPDDAIAIEVASYHRGGRHFGTRLLLRTTIDGTVPARVHIADRQPPGVLVTIGGDPVVYDDPRHTWVAKSSDSATEISVLTPDVITLLDQVWSPTSWADVDNHKGAVRVIVGEESTTASPQRLDQLISLMRHLTGTAQSYNGDPRQE